MVLGIVNVSKRKITTCEDIIDLGGPKPAPRPSRRSYIPNPRLYPGPQLKLKQKRAAAWSGEEGRAGGRVRRRKRAARRAGLVPNARLYRPAPRAPAPPPPPPRPRAAWPPPAQLQAFDTASHVALRVAEQRSAWDGRRSPARSSHSSLSLGTPPPRVARRTPSVPPRGPAQRSERGRNPRLVVTLPGDEPAPRYRPLSQHFQLRSLAAGSGAGSPPPAARRAAPPPAMAASSGASFTPDEGSDGNESTAPSEYLAEFLSAIMRRQYAEALKYCRLILQYEPHNATARGFYPLLQHKLGLRPGEGAETRVPASCGLSSSESSSGTASGSASGAAGGAAAAAEASDAESGDEAESCASLSLDSSSRSSSPSPLAPQTHSSEQSARSALSEGSEARWSSSGSPAGTSRSDPEPDDNGNTTTSSQGAEACAVADENDNAAGGDHSLLLKDSSLQRLRAQFACSIK